MRLDVALIILLMLHALAFTGAVVALGKSNERMSRVHLVWAALLPVFGPAALTLLARTANRPNPDMSWMRQAEEDHRFHFNIRTRAEDTVPLEEALLINDPGRRRSLILSILRSDPMAYLDLLMVARFNEDTETAHYAASTIMELQRQIQMEIQRQQREIEKDAMDMEGRIKYIDLLNKYCNSGLMEGQFLRRQRLVLDRALADALNIELSEALLYIQVKNALALEKPSDAKQAAERMLAKWPQSETAWLAAFRVAVETRDGAGLKGLMNKMRHFRIDWTKNGREQLALWTEDGR